MKSFILRLFIILAATPIFAQSSVEIFEPTAISKDDVFGLTISPDGKEAFWVNSNGGRDTLTIMHSHKLNGKWQKQETAAFSGNKSWKDIDPMFSPDG